MIIREANKEDLPGILKALKASLGETSSQKTEEVWNYKHKNNPFGESRVWVADSDGTIAGVRAFMRWDWRKGDVKYCGFRAVDTATHPDFQGQGIFKKLTLFGITELKKENNSFIFNTPNEQSLPGYLKMNWSIVNKLEVFLAPQLPFSFSSKLKEIKNYSNREFNGLPQYSEDQLYTPKEKEFLDWRYKNNPLQVYEIIESENVFLAFYVKQRKRFNELRISEFLFTGDKKELKILKEIIRLKAVEKQCIVISSSHRIFTGSLHGNFGPVFVVNPLNLTDPDYFMSLHNWKYALGDLELF